MKLYLCTNMADGPGWDQTRAMVVRAESYGAARRLVMVHARVRGGSSAWKVARIREEGTESVILEDFIAG